MKKSLAKEDDSKSKSKDKGASSRKVKYVQQYDSDDSSDQLFAKFAK